MFNLFLDIHIISPDSLRVVTAPLRLHDASFASRLKVIMFARLNLVLPDYRQFCALSFENDKTKFFTGFESVTNILYIAHFA